MRFYEHRKLISFWEMIQYVFFELQHAINCWQNGVKRLKVLQSRHPQIMPSDAQIEYVLDRFKPIVKKCDELSLEHAKERLKTFMTDLQNGQLRTYEVIENETAQICLAIQKELWAKHFIYIPGAKEKFFEQDALFGQVVNAKFPFAKSEIREAGNCLAADFNTAAIFHLMRVVEMGLRALAKKLKVTVGKPPLEYLTWEKIIEQMEQKIAQLKQLPRGKKKAETLEFYHGLMGEFNAFKDVWRNNIMHARKSYNENEALGVYVRVHSFMERLAPKVRKQL
jgi:hypothetical protein